MRGRSYRTDEKRRYNTWNYKTHLFRYRADSDLDYVIEGYKHEKQSLNGLIVALLCEHFEIANPHRVRFDKAVLENFYMEE